MSMALGMSWLKDQRDYALRFGEPVPDWLCMCDLPVRVPLVRSAFARRKVADCQVLLDEAGVPAATINNIEQVFANPQVVARDLVRVVPGPDGGTARLIANPIRMSRTPLRDACRAPKLGEHSDEVQHGWPAVNPGV